MKKTTPKKIYELEEALKPYHEFWDVWILSKGCFLKRREIDVILGFRKHQNFSAVALSLEISHYTAYEVFNRALRRLGYNYKLYRHWIADKMLSESGVYDDMSEVDKFLITPLHYHGLPTTLGYSLSVCGETMGDVLTEYGERDLLRLRNFGKKKLNYLRSFLKQNNCLHLLKKQVDEVEKTDKVY